MIGAAEDFALLGSDVAFIGNRFPTFQGNVVATSSMFNRSKKCLLLTSGRTCENFYIYIYDTHFQRKVLSDWRTSTKNVLVKGLLKKYRVGIVLIRRIFYYYNVV